MEYRQTIDYLFSLQKFGIKFGLSSTENLLAGLGRPQDHLPCLHLAGTNGKGSVGATITAILAQAGYKVGFYTSPHLVSFRERFVVRSRDSARMIDRPEVERLVEEVRAVSSPEEPPTFFEFVTAMAFLYFQREKVDLAVMETGMGGRLDATNVITPLVSVITNISVEHTEYLGPTLTHIAREKAGIIKPGRPVVTGERRPRIRDIFEETARKHGGRLLALGRDFQTRRRPGDGFDYQGLGMKMKGLEIKLLGRHQIHNAGLALAAVELLREEGFRIEEQEMRAGLLAVSWPGRAERFPGGPNGPDLMLDGAHNPAGARTLARLLQDLDYRHVHLVLGIMADKDIAGIMGPLTARATHLYLTRPEYSRAADPATLIQALGKFGGPAGSYPTIPTALAAARAAAGPGDLILVSGSLFTVGEARAYLLPQGQGSYNGQ